MGARRPSNPAALSSNITRLAELGLSVNLSEMDVRVNKLPMAAATTATLPGDALAAVQAQIYRDTLAACFAHKAFSGVTFWGFTDKHSWCDAFYAAGSDALLFDRAYARKPAYFAVAQALRPGAAWAPSWTGEPWYPPSPARTTTSSSHGGTALPDWELSAS